jgi:hypothetical protein
MHLVSYWGFQMEIHLDSQKEIHWVIPKECQKEIHWVNH